MRTLEEIMGRIDGIAGQVQGNINAITESIGSLDTLNVTLEAAIAQDFDTALRESMARYGFNLPNPSTIQADGTFPTDEGSANPIPLYTTEEGEPATFETGYIPGDTDTIYMKPVPTGSEVSTEGQHIDSSEQMRSDIASLRQQLNSEIGGVERNSKRISAIEDNVNRMKVDDTYRPLDSGNPPTPPEPGQVG